jgi:hypothetical protein
MAIMSTIDTAGDDEYVLRFLTAVNGYKPSPSAEQADDFVLPNWVMPFLSHLAAALRIHMWERAGLTSRLPEKIPSAAEVLFFALGIPQEPSTATLSDIPNRVFKIWLQNFARAELMGVGTNVVVELHDDILDQVAEFLLSLQTLPNSNN